MGAKLLPARIRWLVSGTPVQNSKQDFYSLCSMIRLPASFYTEAQNLRPLARSFILKRTKLQVGIQMTDVLLDKNVVNWKNSKEMELSEEIHSALNFSRVSNKKSGKLIVNSMKNGGTLALMLRARQTCIYPKLMSKKLSDMAKYGFIGDYSSYNEAFDCSSKLDSVVNKFIP